MSTGNHCSREEIYVQVTGTRCYDCREGIEVARVQECVRGEGFPGDDRHSAELDKRVCRGSRPIDEIDKSDKREVLLGRETKVSDEGDKREGGYL